MHSLRSLALSAFSFAVGCGASAPPAAPASPPAGAEVGGSALEARGVCLGEVDAAAAARAAPAASARATFRHVLVKHIDAKNPVDGVTRARGEACLRAKEARLAMMNGLSFDEAVAQFSDEPGAATRAGSVGEVTPGDLDPAFAAGAFELERGQVSDVVESPSGFHLILRAD
jgi:peptidyl-prolyl cis-trans isomerase NIMA-interacting 1